MTRLAVALSAVVAAVVLPDGAWAHGYPNWPPARQVICKKDGGEWGPSDGSNIPNGGCRNAFLESGTLPFTQKNEYATLVGNYENMDAVKAAVKDGLLCAGGSPAKAGMALPSYEWQRTKLAPGQTFTMKFLATAPHNPSFWQFFITKPHFNAGAARMNWDDIEMFQEAGDVQKQHIDGGWHYVHDITLPAGRDGHVTVFVRWQRRDPAGEGFYNCVDLDLGGDAPVAPPTTTTLKPQWTTRRPNPVPTTTRGAGGGAGEEKVDIEVEIEAPEGVKVNAKVKVTVGDQVFVENKST